MESETFQKTNKKIKPQEWFIWNSLEKLYNYHYYCSINECNEIKFSLGLKFYSFAMIIDENTIDLYGSNYIDTPKNIDEFSYVKLKTMPCKFIYGFITLAIRKFKEKNNLIVLTETPKLLVSLTQKYKNENPTIMRKK